MDRSRTTAAVARAAARRVAARAAAVPRAAAHRRLRRQFAADAAALRSWDAGMVDDIRRVTSENNNFMNRPAVTGKTT